jgi:hypothetical protein
VAGRSSTGPAVDYRLDVAYDDYPYETSWSLQRVSRPVLLLSRLSSLYEVTELGHLLWHSVGVIPGDDYHFVILNSIGDGICLGYGDVSLTLYATADDSELLVTSSNDLFGPSQTNVSVVGRL